MTHNMTLTLAAWQDFIWIAVFGAVMLGSWISNLKKQSQEQRKRDEGPNALELEEMAARRREQLRQASHGRAQASGGEGGPAGGASGEPGNMTMAERIARARAKAQYEQRAQGTGQSAQRSQAQVPNEAQRRALAKRQAELERQQQAAHAQQQAQQRARQQAKQRAQQQARQQKAQAHARAQARARQRGKLIHEDVAVPEPTQSTTRRVVKARPNKSPAKQPVRTTQAGAVSPLVSGSLSRNDLRRAIIMNEVLGKPLAMRESEGL